MAWELIWIIFVVALAACAAGFKKFVYFMSVGYGLAIALGAVAILVIFAVRGQLSIMPIIMLALFIVYGIKLSAPLAFRDAKGAANRKTLSDASKSERHIPVAASIFMWIFMAALYTVQLSPVFYRFYNGAKDLVLPIIGVVISVLGLVLEALADRQRAKEKRENPDMAATRGLYRMCRCPNYFGQILFWTGVFVGSWSGLYGVGQWIFAVIGWVSIVVIMFDGAKRLEKRQNRSYGRAPEYREYVKKTPILIPLLPIYTLNGGKEEKSSRDPSK